MKSILGILTVAALLAGRPATPPSPPLSAECVAFRKQKLARTLLDGAPMRPAEKLPAYAKYDFSPLWRESAGRPVYGFIGPAYQRLQVKLLTFQKSATDPTLYTVTGKTRILGVVRACSGTVRLAQVREISHRRPPPAAAAWGGLHHQSNRFGGGRGELRAD